MLVLSVFRKSVNIDSPWLATILSPTVWNYDSVEQRNIWSPVEILTIAVPPHSHVTKVWALCSTCSYNHRSVASFPHCELGGFNQLGPLVCKTSLYQITPGRLELSHRLTTPGRLRLSTISVLKPNLPMLDWEVNTLIFSYIELWFTHSLWSILSTLPPTGAKSIS